MKIEKIEHIDILESGKSKSGGAVEVRGRITMSHPDGGCDLEGCHCSDGYWISIIMPRTEKGFIEGIKVKFENKEEMDKFFKDRVLVQ